jgi:hypothetical protein
LVCSKFIAQQPVEDVDGGAPPADIHGPAIPTDGVNGLVAGSIAGGEAGAGIGEGKVLGPAMSGIGAGIGLTGIGLRPAFMVSTEPNGIPAGEAPPGDGVDIADDDAVPPVELLPQFVVPPGKGIPIANPPPSKVPDVPEDEVEVVVVGHVTPPPIIPGVPTGSGLRPRDGSSVAPMAFPVGGTVVAPVMPGGEVPPIPATVSSICADTGAQSNAIVRIDAISTSRIVVRIRLERLLSRGDTFNASGGFAAVDDQRSIEAQFSVVVLTLTSPRGYLVFVEHA